MSSIVPMTPGLSTGAPTRAGSGSTKPTISTPSSSCCVQLARQRERRRAGADEQQPLARPDLPRQPLERQPPADQRGDRQRRRRREHAAADDQRREPGRATARNEQRGAERLQRADEQLGRLPPALRVVVEIAVIEAELADRR